MADYGKKSSDILSACHPNLIRVMRTVVRVCDNSIRSGYRGEEEQNRLYAAGKSQRRWPDSKHNNSPSLAVDILPYPFYKEDWKDWSKFSYLAGHVMEVAHLFDIPVTWGGDWSHNNIFTDEKFRDMMHFELRI